VQSRKGDPLYPKFLPDITSPQETHAEWNATWRTFRPMGWHTSTFTLWSYGVDTFTQREGRYNSWVSKKYAALCRANPSNSPNLILLYSTKGYAQSNSCSSQPDSEKAIKPYRCPYLVMRLVGKDNTNHMPIWKQRLYRTTPVSSFLAVCFYWVYFVLRIIYTVSAQQIFHKVFVLSWIFIIIEIGVTCRLLVLIHPSPPPLFFLFLSKEKKTDRLS